MYVTSGATATVTNTTFTGNSAQVLVALFSVPATPYATIPLAHPALHAGVLYPPRAAAHVVHRPERPSPGRAADARRTPPAPRRRATAARCTC